MQVKQTEYNVINFLLTFKFFDFMKKLLLTLCAVFAGVAAFAGNIDLRIVDAEGNATNEITAMPGDEVVMHMNVNALDGTVEGAQFQFVMRDASGTFIMPNGKVVLKNQGGNRFIAEGMSTIVGNSPAQTMATLDNGEKAYRVIDANTQYNTMWCTNPQVIADVLTAKEGYEISVEEIGDYGFTDEMFQLGNVFAFTVKIAADWDEEFATLDFDDAYSVFQIKGEGQFKVTEGALDLKIKNGNYTPAEPKDLTGEIVVSEPTEDGLVTVSYNGPEDVTITVNGEEYTEPIQLVDGENVLNVVVSAEGYNNLEESFTINWTAPVVPPEPVDLQGEIVVGEPNEEGVVTIEYTGNENVTVTVTINGEPAEEPYQLVDGMNTIVVTVEGEGFNPMTETFEVEWNAPEPPDDPHMVGKWIVLIDNAGEEHWIALNADPNGENNWSTMLTLHHNPWAENVPFYFMVDGVQMGAESDMYLPAMGNNAQTLLNPVFVGENMFYVPATYTYTFGLQLKDGQYYLLVAQGPQTAVNEINGGKAVAGVRYFNMAGQEMQEANGMTIVVTTYTDGTTSAVKVMK